MIDTLLLDLGGVIMDIDKENCARAFRRLGMTNIEDFLGEYSQKGPFRMLEEGKIGPEEFRGVVRSYIPEPVTNDQIDEAFCDFLLGIPLKHLQALDALRPHYRLFLLSNTNPIMWNSAIERAFRLDGKCREDYFDGMLTSFEAKSMKPDSKIFRIAIEKFRLVPERTLFCDDSETNCHAASRLGLHTRHITPSNNFYDGLLPKA